MGLFHAVPLLSACKYHTLASGEGKASERRNARLLFRALSDGRKPRRNAVAKNKESEVIAWELELKDG